MDSVVSFPHTDCKARERDLQATIAWMDDMLEYIENCDPKLYDEDARWVNEKSK